VIAESLEVEESTPTVRPSAGPDTRRKYNKQDLLARFKQKSEIEMSVFDQKAMFDNIQIFISKQKSAEDDKDDPLDELLEEEEGLPGLYPESVQPTQTKPSHGLQAIQY